jgi:hypothetical protein
MTCLSSTSKDISSRAEQAHSVCCARLRFWTSATCQKETFPSVSTDVDLSEGVLETMLVTRPYYPFAVIIAHVGVGLNPRVVVLSRLRGTETEISR